MAILLKIYDKLYSFYGPQYWWPGDSPFEIAVGAILTQNTNWSNVEKAIKNLKGAKVLSAKALHELPVQKLASLIKPAGYFNIKAKRLKAFIDFLIDNYSGSMQRMKKEDTESLREKLLDIHGIGPETADSILLYALDKPVFVIDAYTKRVLSRHKIMDYNSSYDEYQMLFHKELMGSPKRGPQKGVPKKSSTFWGGSVEDFLGWQYRKILGGNSDEDIQLFNEYHALFVRLGKDYCRPKPLCEKCPLNNF